MTTWIRTGRLISPSGGVVVAFHISFPTTGTVEEARPKREENKNKVEKHTPKLSERDESESSSIILVSGGVSLNSKRTRRKRERGGWGRDEGYLQWWSSYYCSNTGSGRNRSIRLLSPSLTLSLSLSSALSLSLLPLVDIGQTLQHWELSSRIEKLRIKAEEKEKEKNFPIRLHNFVNSAVGHTRLLLLLLVHFLPAQHLIKL
jgi:hypothetical protein